MDMRALLLLLLMLAFPALAADPDPIDAALDACLAKPEGSSTVGMVECTDDAIRAWDKRLNEVYQQVMAGLDSKSQELLRTSQRRWVAFREAEHEAMGGPWRQDRGTIIRVPDGERRPVGDQGARTGATALRAGRRLRISAAANWSLTSTNSPSLTRKGMATPTVYSNTGWS
jgi:uncharacterized protein YecT (DUF1311 family)